jgi:hypothetical protein
MQADASTKQEQTARNKEEQGDRRAAKDKTMTREARDYEESVRESRPNEAQGKERSNWQQQGNR